MLSPWLEHMAALQGGNASLILLLVKATIILLGALAVTLVMQHAAAGARHLVWLVTLCTLLLVPALTVWSPIHMRILPPQQQLAESGRTAPLQASIVQSGAAATADARNSATVPHVSPANRVAATRTPADAAIAWLRNADVLTILFGIWAAIALAIASSLAYATFSLRRVVRAGTPLASQEWLNIIWEVADRLGLESAPTLLQSRDVKMPFACGLVHPTIVLPVESNDWSLERRSAVLLHELAHVRRRDLLGHTLGRVACAVYWFHPLVWTAAKRLRSESERACDDLALTCGTRATDYAEHLLDIVTSVRGDTTPLVALAMARRKEFEGRMLAILDPQLKRAVPSGRKAAALVMSLGVLAIAVGATSPVRRPAIIVGSKSAAAVSMAQSASPATPVPATKTPKSKGSAAGREIAPDALPVGIATGGDLTSVPRVTVGTSDRRTGILTDGDSKQTPDERAELLAKILQTDTSASIRRTAAWGLQQYAGNIPDAGSALVSAVQHDANADVREMCAWALANARDGDVAAIGALGRAAAFDASESVRATAVWSLAHVGTASAAGVLASALSDRSAEVRASAAWALGVVQPNAAPSALIARLKDSDPKVRATTAWALHNIADAASIPALQAALAGEKDANLQIDYIRALAAMGDESVDALRTLLVSPDPEVKSIAVRALAGGRATGPWPWPWPMPRPAP